jgi:hypothetical protein
MYTLTLDEQTYNGADLRYLYYPGDDEYVVSDFTVNLSGEECSTIEFTMYKDHPWFGSIVPRVSMVTFKRDGKILSHGQVHSVTKNLDGSMKVYVVDELSFLLDSVQPQRYLTNITYREVMDQLLQYHRSVMPQEKWFFTGYVEGPGDATAIARSVVTTNFEKTLNVIRDEMAYTTYYNGGVIYMQNKLIMTITRSDNTDVTSTRSLNLVQMHNGPMLRQPIKVGLNMQEYQNTVANEDLATALIPLGARLDTEVVPGLETKVDIKSVNGGLNYIVDDEAVAQYGLIFDVVEYDDVTKPANLKKLAERELANRRKLMDEYTISAVDLSLVDSDFDQFEIGMGVFVDDPTDPQHNVPDFMITGMNINPLDPSGNSITLLKSNWGYS